jgi:hypothetical protein
MSTLWLVVSVTGILLLPRRHGDGASSMQPVVVVVGGGDDSIEPLLAWFEEQQFITNGGGTSIRSNPSSAQYRALKWLSESYYTTTNNNNNTTANNLTMAMATTSSSRMIDSHPYTLVNLFALVTFYYSTGGDTGLWINDRLWLSHDDHLCLWVGVTCGYFFGDDETEMVRDDESWDAADAALEKAKRGGGGGDDSENDDGDEEGLDLYYHNDTAFRVTTLSFGTSLCVGGSVSVFFVWEPILWFQQYYGLG